MRKLYIIVAILTIFAGCRTQQKTVETIKTENNNMRKFNLALLPKDEHGYSSYEYLTKNKEGDSIRVILFDAVNCFMERLFKINTPFSYDYKYDKTTLNVISEQEYFYHCAIGIKKIYNPQGEWVEDIDIDALYKFGWQDLVKLLKYFI